MEHSPLTSRRNSPAAADLSAVDYVRLLHPTGSVGKVSFTIIRRRDEGDVGTRVPKVSLDVTTRDLLDPRFRELLLWDLDSRDLETNRVVLEMVESVLYDENAAQITQACQALVKAGFVLALDDFGTGYASILSLVNLPVSMVKIDRAFTAGVARDARKQALARSMVGIATTFGLEVLAEGVDDAADVAVLRKMGCELFQSFHFGYPMAPIDALKWIGDRSFRSTPLSMRRRI